MTVELIPLCEFTATLGRPEMVADTPRGRRIIAGINNGRLDGDRLHASQRGTTAADWLVIGTDGTAFVDVRISFRTDDGAFIQMTYSGRGDWGEGPMTAPVYSAPYFETDDERYTWLNTIQVVGRGEVAEEGARYELFEVR